MPALSFHKRFAAAVESGEKRQTIRAVRLNPIKPGDTLHLFTGMRTKECRRLGTAVCTEVRPVLFSSHGNAYTEGVEWGHRERQSIARADGFLGGVLTPFGEMVRWFETTHGLPFEGVVIRWELQPDAD